MKAVYSFTKSNNRYLPLIRDMGCWITTITSLLNIIYDLIDGLMVFVHLVKVTINSLNGVLNRNYHFIPQYYMT